MLARHALIFILALSSAAAAQAPNSGFLAPDTRTDEHGLPSPGQTNNTDRLFLQLALAENSKELAIADAAAKQDGASSAMRAFAKRMQADHQSMGERLKALADDVKLPPNVPPEPKTEIADEAGYWQSQIIGHQKMVQLLIWEKGSGEYAALQKYSQEMLPLVLKHLTDARTAQHEFLTQNVARTVD